MNVPQRERLIINNKPDSSVLAHVVSYIVYALKDKATSCLLYKENVDRYVI